MPEPRDYDNVGSLLGSRNGLEEQLKGLDDEDLEELNTYLTYVDFNHGPIGDWRNLLASGEVNRLFSETELCYTFQDIYGPENVTLNADIEDRSNSKDFDVQVSPPSLDSRIWVEITLTDFYSTIKNVGGGRAPTDMTGRTIDRKLCTDFEVARENLGEAEVLVLAVFLQAPDIQPTDIKKWLDQEYYDVGEYADGLLTFTHISEREISYYPFTEDGREIEAVMEALMEDL